MESNAGLKVGILVAVGLALQKRPVFSAITLGLACLAKFTPLFGLPLFLICWEGGSKAALATAKGQLQAAWNWRVMLKPRAWRYPALTIRLSGAASPPRKPAPLLGEHNQYVFGQLLGLADDELRGLTEAGVLT